MLTRASRRVRPDLLFATLAEARALLAGGPAERLLDLAAIAVVKRGGHGATVLARARRPMPNGRASTSPPDRLDAPDTTGAGDAFDAGFLVAWVLARRDRVPMTAALHRSAVAGHRAAARHLSGSRPELALE